MPLATRIDDALADAKLNAIVSAIGSIADTLADLNATVGLAHRDLKPQNLYVHGDTFAVGDFGLVALPDAEHLTAPGKVVGPANFVAYEMMEHPLDADPAPADVYSLAKTLWVLATGSRWPPPGHQAEGVSPRIGEYRPHAHAVDLDRLIDRSTRLNPLERPRMSDFAADLARWGDLRPPASELTDLASVAAELRRRAAPHVDAAAAENRQHAAAYELSERFEARLQPATALLEESSANLGTVDGGWLTGTLGTRPHLGSVPVIIRHAAGGSLRGYDRFHPWVLHYGGLVELIEGGTVRVGAAIALNREGVLATAGSWVGDVREAPVESLAASDLVDAAVDELLTRLPGWLRQFAERA